MGAEQSFVKYEGPPDILEARDIPSLVKYIKSDRCRDVFVMLGAGASTSAGIPDFRSPGTGLYSNLARLSLPYPEAVFDISFFRENPLPFYTLAKELLPGHFRPTLTHCFVRLLHAHHLLRMCFTQNIDTLERRAGVPGRLLVEAHGSFADQHCIDCRTAFDDDTMRECLLKGEIAHCDVCGGLVKPDIVFFGEALPDVFHGSIPMLRSADLLFVIGTSLTVQPFASLASMVPDGCPRVLVNLDAVGDFGSRPDDVLCLGKCDDVVRDIARSLGWEDELNALWEETAASVEYPPVPVLVPAPKAEELGKEEAQLEEEIEEITAKMARVLNEQEKKTEEAAPEREKAKSPFQVTAGEEVLVIEDKTVDANTGASGETPAGAGKPESAVEAHLEPAAEAKHQPAAEAKAEPAVEEKAKPAEEEEPHPAVEAKLEAVVEAKAKAAAEEKAAVEKKAAAEEKPTLEEKAASKEEAAEEEKVETAVEEEAKVVVTQHAKLIVEPKAGPVPEGEYEPAVEVKIINEPVVELKVEPATEAKVQHAVETKAEPVAILEDKPAAEEAPKEKL